LKKTRPDISFVVQPLSKFVCKPKLIHHKTALKVLHYLKSSPSKGLFYS